MAVTRKFYRSFPDRFDSVIVWTSFDSDLDDAFAFEVTVQNAVQGIGGDIFNDASIWGSAGNLETFVFMGDIHRYPSSPDRRVMRAGGRPTILGLLAHEFGHRWLAEVRFIDNSARSTSLLGRQLSHWSFFLDSDASFLEGNDIFEDGDGSFRTVATVSRYSSVDLYLMGLAPPEEVAPFFFLANGSGESLGGEPVTNESPPQREVILTGTKQQVILDDIVRAEGPRRPGFQSSPKAFQQAWILLYRRGERPSAEIIGRLDVFRTAWEAFFQKMTLGRAGVSPILEP